MQTETTVKHPIMLGFKIALGFFLFALFLMFALPAGCAIAMIACEPILGVSPHSQSVEDLSPSAMALKEMRKQEQEEQEKAATGSLR